mmetsp:Transcript_21550/g.61029  ORF Transcript_21550/g.61029 Transcript_21550/m.61029 type:complete len:298 (-) Transcript_21550:275-1168(-)
MEGHLEDCLVGTQGLRVRRPASAAVEAAADAARLRRSTLAAHGPEPAFVSEPACAREASVDSFQSATSEGCDPEAEVSTSASALACSRRAGLPRLQTSFAGGDEEHATLPPRPWFLPPMPPDKPTPIGQWREAAEQRRMEAESQASGSELEEFLTWLPHASGADPDHVARIVAWLLHVVRWSEVDELSAITEPAIKLLPDRNLERIFQEALAASTKMEQFGVEKKLLELVAAATDRGGADIGEQRILLCLASFVALVSDSDELRTLAPPWTGKVRRNHQHDDSVSFWATSLRSVLEV